jgi:ferric-dicitrate binding protein FerR (iron transport regulator)
MNQSNFNKYKSYSSKDLAADDDFVRFVCNPKPEDITFWNEFLQIFPENGQAVREANLLILALQPDSAMIQAIEIDKLWTSLSTQHDDFFRAKESLNKIDSPKKRAFLGNILGLILFFFVVYLTHLFKEKEIYVYQTGFDQVASVLLPENSEVKLNANSTLKIWTSGFLTRKWEILLTGEAYFDIKKDKLPRAFPKMLIHTNSGTVEVKGTTFNVYARGQKTKIYLREGKVKINNLPDLPVIYMNPGDYIQYDIKDKTVSKKKVASEMIDSWIYNKVVFEKTKFMDVLDHIKEVHGIEYVLNNNSLKDKLFTGVLPADNLSLLLKALEETFDIHIIEKNKTISITLK